MRYTFRPPVTGTGDRRATILGIVFVGAGLLHFLLPRTYVGMLPRALPAHRELVYVSGAAEMAGGAGLLSSRTRRPAGLWLILTMIAVFPANVNMAVNAERFRRFPPWTLWARLPLQGLIIAWIGHVSR
jgi:uncharacterized membrane protein